MLDSTLVLDLAVAVQVFGRRPSAFERIRAEERSPYEVLVCGRAPAQRTTMGFTAGALSGDEEIVTADTVVVPGLDRPERPHDQEVLDAIAAAKRNGARLVSLCAGAFVLGEAGALDGHRVTTHWALADELRARYPAADVQEEELFIDDGQVLTSGGMLAGADLCLHVLRQDFGQAYANDVARLLVSPPHRTGGQLQYATSQTPVRGALAPLLQWMLDHLDDDLTIEVVASRAGMSQRTLARRFRTELGESVAGWIAARRVDRARALLETSDRSVTEVAYTSGFGSPGSFRRAFVQAVGATPRQYRSTFRT